MVAGLSPRQRNLLSVLILSAFPLLLGLVLLGRVGGFVPFGFVTVLLAVVWSVGNLRFGVIATVVLTLLIPTPLSFPVGPFTIGIPRLIGFATIVGWVAALSRERGPLVRRSSVDGAIAFVMFSYLLSLTVNSPSISGPLFGSAIQRVLVLGIDYFLFFVVAISVLGAGRRHLDLALRVVGGTIVLTALIGLYERASGTNVFDLLGPLYPSGFRTFVAALADASVETRGGVERIQSTFVGPNQFGAVLVMGVPVLLHLSATVGSRLASRIWLIGAGLCVFASIFTASRSVLVGMATVFVVYGVATARVKVTRTRVAAAFLVVVAGLAFNPAVRATFQVYFTGLGGFEERSVEGRIVDYRNVFDQLEETPIAGSGPGTWATGNLVESGRVDPDDPAQAIIDNTYLVTLAELGIVGFFAIVAFMWGSVYVGWRAVRRARAPAERSLRAALFCAVLWFAIANAMFDMLAFFDNSRLYLFLLASLLTAGGEVKALRRPLVPWAPGANTHPAPTSTLNEPDPEAQSR
jgi:O-antigen ligase